MNWLAVQRDNDNEFLDTSTFLSNPRESQTDKLDYLKCRIRVYSMEITPKCGKFL